jgi:capsular exopolysaccharide synthesis family protein
MTDVESQMGDSDQTITQFLESDGGPLVWSAESKHLMERLSSLIELREQSQTLIAAEQRKLNDLTARLEEEPEWVEHSKTFTRDHLWDKYRVDLAELRKELAAARTTSGQKNPKVEALEAQISEIEKDMKDIGQEATSPSGRTESRSSTYQALLNQKIQAELDLIAHKAQLEMVDDMLNELSGEVELMLSEMPGKQFQLDKMNREVEYKVELYKSLLEKKLEAEIWASENSDDNSGEVRGGIEIVDTAQPGGRPVSPRIKFIGAIAALVGLVVGLGMAFLAEYFENTYQSTDEAKVDLDTLVLGTIPSIKIRHPGEFILPALDSATSAEAESFRTLVTNIEFSSSGKPYEGLLVTSSAAGEGKSFVAANLAVTMAHIRSDLGSAPEGQVILVDCDMRKAVQHKIFDVENQSGLANLLVGNADLRSVMQDTDVSNLKLITCGPAPPNPIELLRSQRAGKVLKELKEACGVLICDSPPILPVADALILATKLDGVLLVTDLDRTPREMIKQAREQLSKLDVPLLGLICNRVGTAKYGSYYHHKSSARQITT